MGVTATVVLGKVAPAEARAEMATAALAPAVLVGTREAMATVARDKEETAVVKEGTAMEVLAKVARAAVRAVMATEARARVVLVGTKVGMETEAPAPGVRVVVKVARLVMVAARAARSRPPPPRVDLLVVVTVPTRVALVGTMAATMDMEMEALMATKEARLATRHRPAVGATGYLEDIRVDPMTEGITAKALAVLLARLDLLAQIRQRKPRVVTRSSPAAAGWDHLATVDATQSRVSLSIACLAPSLDMDVVTDKPFHKTKTIHSVRRRPFAAKRRDP